MFIVIVGALLAGCVTDPHGGTAVGNPTGLSVDSATSPAVTLTDADAMVTRVVVAGCEGWESEVPVDREVSLLGEGLGEVDLTEACSMRMEFGGPLTFEGEGPGHSTFLLELLVQTVDIDLARPTDIERTVLRLAPPGWISATTLGLERAAEVTVVPGDVHYEGLVEAIESGSALYADRDGDGHCGGDECDGAALGEAGE